jgi:PEP-CTERM motif-containing protein
LAKQEKGSNMSIKSLLAASAVALALVAPVAQGSATFQGVTFTFTQIDADTLQFEMSGTTPLGGDWSTAAFLGAFDLKDLGLDFSKGGATATLTGPGGPVTGLNSQLSAKNFDCSAVAGKGEKGSVCFDFSPDLSLGASFDFIWMIDFSAPLSIAAAGPHLQVVFTETDGGGKVGSLYSQNVALSSSGPSSSGPSSSGPALPEPGTLALLGAALASLAVFRRRGEHKV